MGHVLPQIDWKNATVADVLSRATHCAEHKLPFQISARWFVEYHEGNKPPADDRPLLNFRHEPDWAAIAKAREEMQYMADSFSVSVVCCIHSARLQTVLRQWQALNALLAELPQTNSISKE